MRRLKEDPEVVVLAVVLALFAGTILTIRPNRMLIAVAEQAARQRQAAHEAWLLQHPVLRGLRLALTLDGTVETAGWIEHPMLAEQVTYVPGRFQQAVHVGPGARIVVREVSIRPESTWALWARIDPGAATNGSMRIMAANGCEIGIEGDRLLVQLYDGQSKVLTAPRPPVGAWFHVAMAWAKGEPDGTLTLYVNGQPVGTRAYANRVAYPWRPVTIGAGYDYSRPFTGDIDDVCTFDRTLNADDVAALAWLGLRDLKARRGAEVTSNVVQAARETWLAAQPPESRSAPTVTTAARVESGLYRELALGFTFDHGLEPGPSAHGEFSMRGTPSTVSGQFGQACRFGGADLVAVSNVAIKPEGTWSAWVRLAGDDHGAQPMRVMDANGTGFQVEGQQWTGFLFEESGTHYVGTLVSSGTWFHVAMTWGLDAAGKGSLRLYKNGESVSVSAYGGRPGYPVRQLVVGASWDFNRGFQGALDDVCVFNRCLSAEEVRELMARGLTEWEAGAVGRQGGAWR
ncbi:MAG: LamG domain-containing protein [Lentisphaerae bacterium]|nr:LamG domain-containing protein [Lentisphaerota bacterium]